MQMRVALLGALVLAATGTACNEEPLQVLAPKIEIAYRDQTDGVSPCAKGFVRDCTHAFGDVGIGQGKFLYLNIKNPSPVDLAVLSIKLEQDGDAFSFEGELPTVVESDLGEVGKTIALKFVPRAATPLRARIVIDSNAKNIKDDEMVVIELTGNGIDLGSPEIRVTPPECDFGDVGVGVTAYCDLNVFNDGNRELQLTDVGIVNDSDTVFGAQSVLVIPTFIPNGTGISVRLYAMPTAPVEQTGTFTISSNDPSNPTVTVPLRVRGAEAPTAIGRIKSINGVPNDEATPSIEPLDNVVVSADQSVPGRDTGSIVAWQWELIEQPAESSVTLTDPNSEDTGFEFSSAAGWVSGLDVVGTYVVRLTVTDDTGAVSTNDARVTLNAVPTEGFHVQLTWDAAVNDIDLHVGRGTDPDWCSDDDCYFGNCDSGGLDWDGVNGTSSAGDPHLDIDDLSGYGPENINIENPVNGSYLVGVDFWGGSQSTFVTIKIFLGGALAWEGGAQMSNSSQFWEAARVDYNNGVPTVIAIESMSSTWSCSL